MFGQVKNTFLTNFQFLGRTKYPKASAQAQACRVAAWEGLSPPRSGVPCITLLKKKKKKRVVSKSPFHLSKHYFEEKNVTKSLE
ncbi:hypothetical protein Hanom_Chr14g01245841 [Helianthus anomalus]